MKIEIDKKPGLAPALRVIGIEEIGCELHFIDHRNFRIGQLHEGMKYLREGSSTEGARVDKEIWMARAAGAVGMEKESRRACVTRRPRATLPRRIDTRRFAVSPRLNPPHP